MKKEARIAFRVGTCQSVNEVTIMLNTFTYTNHV